LESGSKRARLDRKVTLDTMANETGLAKDVIKQIESGSKRPSVGTLLQMSRVLQLDSDFLLKDAEEAREKRSQAYAKRTDQYAYTPLTPGAEKQAFKGIQDCGGSRHPA
jgi:transcriptional regulator with XRE-family HTH domain